MYTLLLSQLSGLATRVIMGFVVDLIEVLTEREDSSIDKDGKVIVDIIKKNIEEDKVAGYDKKRSYSNNELK